MLRPGKARQWHVFCLAVGGMALVAGVIVHHQLEEMRRPAVSQWERIALGMSRADVIARLGQPVIRKSAAECVGEYYLSGYAFKRRPVSNEVLIYLKADMVFYVWIDFNGKVEDTFRGVS